VEYVLRDEHLLDAIVDPVTGEVVTFTGWRDPNYAPEPGATPFPACWTDEFESGGGSPAPSVDPGAAVVEISASTSTAFDQSEVTAPADTAFTIHFSNQESGVPHNVEIKDAGGTSIARGEIITGVAEADYSVPALAAGEYPFTCSVHPNMTGTLTAE
jgi:plastocyanin